MIPEGKHRRRALEETLRIRFWIKVDVKGPDDCWEWQGARSKEGYGRIARGHDMIGAHRVAWELANGPIPEGMQVLHKCDNPPCCNAKHLFVGTNNDNIQDKVKKKRHIRPPKPRKTHEQAH